MREVERRPYVALADLCRVELRILDAAARQQAAKQKTAYESFHIFRHQLKVISSPPVSQSLTLKSKSPLSGLYDTSTRMRM